MSKYTAILISLLLLTDVSGQEARKHALTAEIRGRVVDFFGIPWKDASVKLRSKELPAGGNQVERTVDTTEQGEYRFADLPEGSYELTFDGGFGALKETRTTHVIQTGEVLEIDIGLELGLVFCKPKQIYGSVKDNRGKPIENSSVVLSNAFKQNYRRMARSTAQGEYVVDVCIGGQYLVYAYAPGYEIQTKHIMIPKDTSKAFSSRLDFRLPELGPEKLRSFTPSSSLIKKENSEEVDKP